MSVAEPAIGIDVGGTKCLAVLSRGATEIARSERSTPSGSAALIETIVELTRELESWNRTASDGIVAPLEVGVGLPGLVTRQGVLRAAPNLTDVLEFEAGKILSDVLGRQVWVDNDATCAAVSEWLEGAGSGCDDLLVVTIGTGIGAGIVANGSLLRGANGFAGELGHMIVDPAGPQCPCGRSGCWERYASGSGLAFLARRYAQCHGEGSVAGRAGSIDEIRGEHVTELALAGNSEALAIVDEFARWVAVGLANMTNVLDPERIVLGGGAVRMGDLLIAPVREHLSHVLYAAENRPVPVVCSAHFGESAGAIGAAMLHRVHRGSRVHGSKSTGRTGGGEVA